MHMQPWPACLGLAYPIWLFLCEAGTGTGQGLKVLSLWCVSGVVNVASPLIRQVGPSHTWLWKSILSFCAAWDTDTSLHKWTVPCHLAQVMSSAPQITAWMVHSSSGTAFSCCPLLCNGREICTRCKELHSLLLPHLFLLWSQHVI